MAMGAVASPTLWRTRETMNKTPCQKAHSLRNIHAAVMAQSSTIVRLLLELSAQITGVPADDDALRFSLSLLGSFPAARFTGSESVADLLELVSHRVQKRGEHGAQIVALRRKVQSSRSFQKSAK